jgi:two-component system phosphate regulon sensor histidine kinase PhoR
MMAGPGIAPLILATNGIAQTNSGSDSDPSWYAVAIVLLLALSGMIAFHLWSRHRSSKQLSRLRRETDQIASDDDTDRAPFVQSSLGFRFSAPDNISEMAIALERLIDRVNQRMATIDNQRRSLETVVESMVEGVVAFDQSERLTRINPAAAELLDVLGQRVTGRSIREVVRNRALQELVSKVLSEGGRIEQDIVLYASEQDESGTRSVGRFLQVHGTTLDGASDEPAGVLLVLSDVTRLRRLEVMRREFVANVSHEVRTPVTAILGAVETLLDMTREDHDPEQTERFLRMIERHGHRLQALVDDVLDLARAERSDGEGEKLDRETVAVRSILVSAAEICTDPAEGRGIRIETECPPDLEMDANQVLIEQAVINLMENAIKYGPRDSVLKARAFLEESGDRVVIEVEDQGPGIESVHLPRLFERFYRLDRGRSRQRGGTGLGLAIVKHIAHAHGGRVSVDSELNVGSTFRIHLPRRVEPGRGKARNDKHAPDRATPPTGSLDSPRSEP